VTCQSYLTNTEVQRASCTGHRGGQCGTCCAHSHDRLERLVAASVARVAGNLAIAEVSGVAGAGVPALVVSALGVGLAAAVVSQAFVHVAASPAVAVEDVASIARASVAANQVLR